MNIAVLVSGGVDSSVALALLKEKGHNLTAFYLKIWLEDELSFLGDCPWEQDLMYVRQVCHKLDVPLKIISLQKEYFAHVVSYTIDEIRRGHTPNPDMMCNNQIKFGFFWRKIEFWANNSRGPKFDLIASGHYAQKLERHGRFFLKQAPDPVKDQTYFLARLDQKQLAKIIFPIGHLSKVAVREMAGKFNLPNKNRKDSQGICFLGKLKFREFVRHYLGVRRGDLVEFETGRILAEHDGYWYFTIGQRQGIKLADGPWYVVDKDVRKNIVYVSQKYHEEDKIRDEFMVDDVIWFAGKPPPANSSRANSPLRVKLRHGRGFHDCQITSIADAEILNPPAAKYQVKLAENDQGIAAGQFAVFYQDDICLGSGMIKFAIPKPIC